MNQNIGSLDFDVNQLHCFMTKNLQREGLQVEQDTADVTTTLEAFISNLGMHDYQVSKFEESLNSNFWQIETPDKQAAVVPDNYVSNCAKVEFCDSGQPNANYSNSNQNILSTHSTFPTKSNAIKPTINDVPQSKPKQTGQKRRKNRAVDEVQTVPTAARKRKRRKQKSLEEQYNGHGVPQLWQFILQLLVNSTGDICWTHNAPFEFKFRKPENVARLWGKAKGNENMNYDKLSRGLRNYYDKNIISKGNGKKHVYRFECDIVSILKYDPTACSPENPDNACTTSTSTPFDVDQRNPLSFAKTKIDSNSGNSFPVEVVSNEMIFPQLEFEVNSWFPFEFTHDEEFFFDDSLEALDNLELSDFNAFKSSFGDIN